MMSIFAQGRIKFFIGLFAGCVMMYEYNSVYEKHNYNTRELQHLHIDTPDDSFARSLYKKVRVACWVMTTKMNHQKKAIHVKNTWGKRCNKLFFASEAEDPELPIIKLNIPLGYDHLTGRTMQAYNYLYENELNNYDWFLKADDDTYVIVENLRYLLSAHNPEDPLYFGHHFKNEVKQGFMVGGAGYAISREALRRYGNRKPGQCLTDSGAEDVVFGQCMENLGIKPGDSRDKLLRTRFHHFMPAMHIHGDYPGYYYKIDKYGAKKGMKSISDHPISFHYVKSKDMYNLEYFVYHLWAYGIDGSHQQLNIETHTTVSQAEEANDNDKNYANE